MPVRPKEEKPSRSSAPPPIVFVASGLDPTGSAGILADARVLGSLGCHPCGVVTCETVQSSCGLTAIHPTDPDVMEEQISVLMKDLTFAAIKIGALASVKIIKVLGRALGGIPDVPIVLDPVFAPTDGPDFLNMDGMKAMSEHLLKQTSIATPNIGELGAPAGLDVDQDNDEMILGCASGWFAAGVEVLLVTGLDREGVKVDRLIQIAPDAQVNVTDIPHKFHPVGDVHGTGCVLSSAIAGFIARGEKLEEAVRKATEYSSGLIKNAEKLGEGARFWIE